MYKVQKYRPALVKAGILTVSDRSADSYENARDIFFALLAKLPHEEVHLLLLNGRSEVIGTVKVAQGGMHGCALTARDVLCPVVAGGAAAFIMAHNHPSGDPTPSSDDITMTEHVKKCADLIGIPLLDHIVVCPEKRLARSVLDP
jgi:DNA repair protein RadC